VTENTTRTEGSVATGLLTPSSRAVAGLALAVAGLLGQNVLSTGLQLVLMGGSGPSDIWLYTLAMGLGAALPAVLALVLVWGQARAAAGPGWSPHVARAAVAVALLALVGAALTVLGGLLHHF